MLLENMSSHSSSSDSFTHGAASATIRSQACLAHEYLCAFCRARSVNPGGNIALAVFRRAPSSPAHASLSAGAGLAKSTISEILAGKKPFSRQMIRTLAEYFHVDVSVLAGNI
jgi:hypothetical protein